MPDLKLTALAQGTVPNYLYGEEGGTSKKYQSLQIFNVRNYLAVGDGATNDAAAIQNAVNAAVAAGGGIVYFPAGNYRVNSAIVFNANSVASLRLVGVGSTDPNFNGGSRLITFGQNYIFYCHNTGGQGGNQPIASIENLAFTNSFNPGAHGTITSTELAGGGYGCIYHTAGANVLINCCSFNCPNGGIGLFANSICLAVNSCLFQGPFGSATHAEDSYGIISNSISLRDTRLISWGVGVTCSAPALVPYLMMDGGDLENNGCAVRLGYIPITQWDPFTLPNGAATTGPSIAIAHIRNVGFESNGDTDGSSNAAGNSVAAVIDIYRTQGCVLENIRCQNIARSQANGIAIRQVNGVILNNVLIQGGGSFGFTNAAINFTIGGDTICYYVTAINGSFAGHGANDWILPTAPWSANRGITFDGCANTSGAFAGAMTLANMPQFTAFGSRMLISDSQVVAVGNFGQTVVGSGTHGVYGQSDGANHWTIVG